MPTVGVQITRMSEMGQIENNWANSKGGGSLAVRRGAVASLLWPLVTWAGWLGSATSKEPARLDGCVTFPDFKCWQVIGKFENICACQRKPG